MWQILIACCLVVVGHLSGALVLYLNHRFVFHGKLETLPFFRMTSKLHMLHHKHTYSSNKNDYLKTPIWGKAGIGALIIFSGIIIGWFFALGVWTFSLLYATRHYAIHNHDSSSRFYRHHDFHHRNIKYNFSGISPFVDRVFGTSR